MSVVEPVNVEGMCETCSSPVCIRTIAACPLMTTGGETCVHKFLAIRKPPKLCGRKPILNKFTGPEKSNSNHVNN